MITDQNEHKGYLAGLQAAALICQEDAGQGKTSHLSEKIMKLHTTQQLKFEQLSRK